MLETKNVARNTRNWQKTCGKPYPPSLNSFEVINFLEGGGGGGGGVSKAPLSLHRDKELKTVQCMNEINFKKQVNLSAVAEYPPTVKSAPKALDTSTASSSATQSAGRYFPKVRISSSVENIEYRYRFGAVMCCLLYLIIQLNWRADKMKQILCSDRPPRRERNCSSVFLASVPQAQALIFWAIYSKSSIYKA